jgi:predicted dehydrogenase
MSQLLEQTTMPNPVVTVRPRLGFLGVGWIGRNRLQSISNSGLAEVVAIADSSQEILQQAAKIEPDAALCSTLEELLQLPLDGIVIATPSAMHAEQAIAALESGYSVFCQKPLGRSAEETRLVVEKARDAKKLLAVDLSYRFISAARAVRALVRSGDLGNIFAADLIFHNAYGPDKQWFYDRSLSGGGCVIDLGIHMVDLALWILGSPPITDVSSRLFAGGQPLKSLSGVVEDFAMATIDLANGTAAQLSCSWNLHAGCAAVINASFYGTRGSASFRNVGGSFFDFTAEKFDHTSRSQLIGTADNNKNWEWGGAAAAKWVRRLSNGERFDPRCEELIRVAEVLDSIYVRANSYER